MASKTDVARRDQTPWHLLATAEAGRKLKTDPDSGLSAEEAALTGEPAPVQKSVAAVAASAPVADRSCMAYSGTLVTYGYGIGMVVATGDSTEIGRISGMLREAQELATPLIRKMAVFARWLTLAILGASAAVFAFGMLVRNYAADEMFLAVVGLAVAAIPEGLPAIMTITLAVGVQRMAQCRAAGIRVKMITAVMLSLAIAFGPAEANVIQRPPRGLFGRCFPRKIRVALHFRMH